MTSMTGSQIAAGVAQTALQAQQVARQRDRQERRAAELRRLPQIIEARLRALEEGDRDDTATSPHIDAQLPEHQPPPTVANARHASHHEPQPQPKGEPSPESSNAGENPLYRHLDVQA